MERWERKKKIILSSIMEIYLHFIYKQNVYLIMIKSCAEIRDKQMCFDVIMCELIE